jgi:3-oxoacyl-[acyl-carrier protein] reductase
MKLKDKVVLVTGGSRGIGRSIALLFASEGAKIAIHCKVHDKEEDELMREIRRKHGVATECFAADVGSVAAIRKMVAAAQKKFGRIDILVNNAGIYPENSFFESTEDIWNNVMDINLKSAYFCSQLVAKIMLKQRSGNIINIASVAGLYPRAASLEYAISKAGMIHFSKSLALTLAPHVRVNAIAPSYTWSGFMPFMKDKKKVKEKLKLIPLGRFNEPEDVANAALFLASDDSRNMTGQVMVIDGGRGAGV